MQGAGGTLEGLHSAAEKMKKPAGGQVAHLPDATVYFSPTVRRITSCSIA